MKRFVLVCATCLVLAFRVAQATELIEAELKSDLVPKPVPYAVLLPDGFKAADSLPLLLVLHGGNGDRRYLSQVRPFIEELW